MAQKFPIDLDATLREDRSGDLGHSDHGRRDAGFELVAPGDPRQPDMIGEFDKPPTRQ
jgi:hypothetical protein